MLHLVSHLSFGGIIVYLIFAPIIILAIWILLQSLLSTVAKTEGGIITGSIILFVLVVLSLIVYDISYIYWLILNFAKLSAFKKVISILLFIWLYCTNRTTTNTAKNRT